MQNLKELYNKTLQRYHNGVDYIFQHEDAKYNKWDELTRRAVRVAKIVMDAYNKEIQKIREKYLAISK